MSFPSSNTPPWLPIYLRIKSKSLTVIYKAPYNHDCNHSSINHLAHSAPATLASLLQSPPGKL